METYITVEIKRNYKIDLEHISKFVDEFTFNPNLFNGLSSGDFLSPCAITVFQSEEETRRDSVIKYITDQGYQMGNVAHMLYIHSMIQLGQNDLVELGELAPGGEPHYVKSYSHLCFGRICVLADNDEFRPGTLFVAFKPKLEE